MKQVQKHLWMVWPCQSSSLGTSMPLMRTTWLRVGTSFLNLSALCASQLLAASSVWKRCWIHLFHASINPYGIRVSSIKEDNVKLQHCHDKNQWWRQLRRSAMSIFASIAESKASSGNKKTPMPAAQLETEGKNAKLQYKTPTEDPISLPSPQI